MPNLFHLAVFSLPVLGLAANLSAATPQASSSQPAAAPSAPVPTPPVWGDDYPAGVARAKSEKKMLLVHFYALSQSGSIAANEARWFGDRHSATKLDGWVLVHVPNTAQITVSGRQTSLIGHSAFGELHSSPGIAAIDYVHQDAEYYGSVVNVLPFSSGKYYHFQPEYVATLLDLPPGSLTQRSMVYAVRTHSERPASTFCETCGLLMQEAKNQSQYQANIGVQGHHNWDSRFQRIYAQLGGRLPPTEVVAESWPNQDLMDSCVDCVASWRQSSGHWAAVSGRHAVYGYDIRRGSNGIWYATGIFAN